MQKVFLILSFMCFAAICHSQEVRVVEKNLVAKIAAKINRKDAFAITIGKTIFISCKKEDFFEDYWWVKHELAHVKQYKKYGIPRFVALYMYYTIFHRKTGNPLEKEAENAEISSAESIVMWAPN